MQLIGKDIAKEFPVVWKILKRQVKNLQIPWLENLTSLERDPFKILISCILSLRTQDRTTGGASQRLFKLASTPEQMARLSVKTIQAAIYPVGFFRVKAQRIKEISREIVERFNSRVPETLEELLKIKGIGRKTANLVITLGYNKFGICVDTHVHRIVNRWGIVTTKNPIETEFRLRDILPKRYWRQLNGILVALGQRICNPISPICSECKINIYCDKVGVKIHR
ncbi:MAG: endonuclease III [Nitrospirota bacterium]